MNNEVIDIVYRSRTTILDHLDEAGWETTPFRKFSPKEIREMIKATGASINGAPALQMELKRKEDAPSGDGESTECLVAYTLTRIKHKIDKFTTEFFGSEGVDPALVKSRELILITLEPIAPNFHTTASSLFLKHGIRVRYFQAAAIINNPLKHVLVPKHEKVPKGEEEALLTGLNAKKTQFPFIRFHEDPIARMIGLLPGDIVKITRPSPTAGECIMYRVCVP